MSQDEELVKRIQEKSERLIKVHQERLETDPEYRQEVERRRALIKNDTQMLARLATAEEANKWKHLPVGSPQAKEHGCVCDEVRSRDCLLHDQES